MVNACINAAITKASKSFTKKDLTQFYKKLERKIAANRDPDRTLSDTLKTLREYVNNEYLNKQLNEKKFSSARLKMNSIAGNAYQKYKGFLISDKTSVGYRMMDAVNQALGNVEISLTKEELINLRSGKMDLDILNEARAPGSTKNSIASSLSKKMRDITEDIRQGTNQSGGLVRELKGRLFKQYHSPQKLQWHKPDLMSSIKDRWQHLIDTGKPYSAKEISDLAFNRWKQFVTPRIDLAKTGIEQSELGEFLKEQYYSFVTTVRSGLSDFDPQVFEKGPNILNRLNASREIFFKDAQSELDYAHEYGRGNLFQSYVMSLEKSASDLAILQNLGTNPSEFHTKMLNTLLEENKTNPEVTKKLKGRTMQAAFETVSGYYKMAQDNGVAKVFSTMRAFISATAFQHSSIPAFFMDPLGEMLRLRNHDGESLIPAFFKGLKNTSQFNTAERAEMGKYTKVFSHHTIGGIQSRLGDMEAPATLAHKTADLTFKLNGLTWIDHVHTESAALTEAKQMADLVTSKEFSDLPLTKQGVLRSYGIQEPEWSALKNADMTVSNHGKYLFADTVNNMDKKDLSGYAASKGMTLDDAQKELSFTVSNYLRDISNFTVMDARDPNIRLLSNLAGGPGTLGGELMRTTLLGTLWPIQYTMRVIWPSIARVPLKNSLSNIVAITAYSTLLAYGMDQADNILSGKTFDDPLDVNSWYNAFKRGGGFGLMQDVFTRYMADPKDEALGVAFEKALKLLQIPADAIKAPDGESGQVAMRELSNWITGNLPFVNLPYAKLLIDHMLLYSFKEAMDPGSVERLQNYAAKNNQSYYWSPTQSVGV